MRPRAVVLATCTPLAIAVVPGGHVEADRERGLVARVVVGRHEDVRAVGLSGGRGAVRRDEERGREQLVRVRLARVRRRSARPGRRTAGPWAAGASGVITSSSPSRANFAGRPLTVTPPTESPAKSRSKRESDCVAFARIVTVPSMLCDGDGGRVAQVEVVVLDVIAAVAQRREQAVADAGGTGRRTLEGARRRGEDQRAQRCDTDVDPSHGCTVRPPRRAGRSHRGPR